MLKKLLVILMLVAILVAVIGCSSSANGETAEPAEEPAEPTKVALLLAGPISDMGWNALAYEGLMRIEEQYENVETSYVENVSQSDKEEVFRAFAEQGFDLIIAHGFEFADAGTKVAVEYPDISFAVVSGIPNGSNLSTIGIDYTQQGFIAGAIAGLITESKVVGGIGGMDIPPIADMVKGYGAGAKYIDPEIEVIATMTGNFEDANQCKEITFAMIESGADTIMACADQANLGAVEGAKERGIYYVGVNTDMNDIAPDTVVNTSINDGGVMFTYLYDLYLAGELSGDAFLIGLDEGAVYLGDWHGFEDQIPEASKQKLAEIIEDLASGSIEYYAMAQEIEMN
jgi:basic membrane protein A